MTLKTCRFLCKYPVYVLSNDLSASDLREYEEAINDENTGINIQIIDISPYWHLSGHYAFSSDFVADIGSFEREHGINYRIMCYFHSSVIFDIPEIAALDYYMRMDDDSELICSNGNALFDEEYAAEMDIDADGDTESETETESVDIDIFEYMMHKQYIYGYWQSTLDPYDWTRGLIPFVLSYKKRHNLRLNLGVPRYMEQWDELGLLPNATKHESAPMFFNNWELVFVPFFRSKAVRRFNQAVIATNGHFLYRWGDAPLRYFQLALFVNQSKLLCLQSPMWSKYFSYSHKNDWRNTQNCHLRFDQEEDDLAANQKRKNKMLFSSQRKSATA